jgi:hypothetical protein
MNKEKTKIANRKYYLKNKEKIQKQILLWKINNKDRCRMHTQKYLKTKRLKQIPIEDERKRIFLTTKHI